MFKLPDLTAPIAVVTTQQTNSIKTNYAPLFCLHACHVVCSQSIYGRVTQSNVAFSLLSVKFDCFVCNILVSLYYFYTKFIS